MPHDHLHSPNPYVEPAQEPYSTDARLKTRYKIHGSATASIARGVLIRWAARTAILLKKTPKNTMTRVPTTGTREPSV